MFVEYDFKDDIEELTTYAKKIADYCNMKDCSCGNCKCPFYISTCDELSLHCLFNHTPFRWTAIINKMEDLKNDRSSLGADATNH